MNYARNNFSASGAAHRALASHKPIIKTDDPSLEDIPGLTVPRFSSLDMYQSLVELMESTSLQKELVEQADQVSLETSWDVVAKMHKGLYEDLNRSKVKP